MDMSTTTLLTGRGLVESPRWHDGRLYFSDWSAGEVLAVGLDGRSDVIARVRSLPLCAAWRPDGRLLIVSSADGKLLRLEPDGSLVTQADLGSRGTWNDIVIDGRGNAYVNGAGFDPTADKRTALAVSTALSGSRLLSIPLTECRESSADRPALSRHLSPDSLAIPLACQLQPLPSIRRLFLAAIRLRL